MPILQSAGRAAQAQAEQPRKAKRKRPDWMLILLPAIGIAGMLVILTLSDSFTSPQSTSSPRPTIAAEPVATLRSACYSQDGVSDNVLLLPVLLTGTPVVDIMDTQIAFDDDGDGRQTTRIKFQAYTKSTGNIRRAIYTSTWTT